MVLEFANRECLYKFAALKFFYQAGVAQLVEHNLAKVRVASSSLVFCSIYWYARVVKLVDTQDLKSCRLKGLYGFDSRPGYQFLFILQK